MKRLIILCMSLGLMTMACSDRDDDITSINIRINNKSSLVFDEVLVGDEDHIYEALDPDTYSEYKEFETAYSYAYIRITSGEEVYVLQPIDFVGEEILPIGLYTYELDIDTEGQVTLEFSID
ncbi:hypothetical protein [Muriicola sp.]|uniref:hypothetical protein n=1 Tax=Muriicola sp. TaxID=2020856 RepID=UPI003C74EE5A